MPPPPISSVCAAIASGVGAPLSVSAGRISANSSAAAPSLNRLSLSMISRSRPLTPASRSMAMTAIGSVAAISAPKASAGVSGQPSAQTSPPVTTAAPISTPIVDSTSTGARSRLSSRHEMLSAASNSSGGRMTSNSTSWVSARSNGRRASASARPVATRPTV